MISGINKDAHNIFANTSDSLSGSRCGGNGASESHLRDLSRKDTMSANNITKDELSYEFDGDFADQMDQWQDEEFERSFGTFK